MSCLNEITCGNRVIIGIRDYDSCAKPESGLYINDIPGISLKLASKVSNEEFHTGAELLKAKIALSTKLVFDEFKERISPYFNFDAIVESRELQNFNTTIISASNLDRGLILKRWRSELSQIYIESVYVKVNASGVGTIKIIDGSITKEYTVDALPDQVVEVDIRYTAKSEQVKILMNDTNFGVYSGSLNNISAGGCRTCSSKGEKHLFITGWNGTSEEAKLFGLGVNASVRCYEENIICSILPRMYFLLWQKSGIEFLKEQIYSDRINPMVNLTKDKAKELKAELEEEYKERYDVFVKSIYNYLRQTKGECITCNGSHYVQRHP